MNLDIGCGLNKTPGYTGIDNDVKSNADILASALFLPIQDNTIDKINCSHLVEHLHPDETVQLFGEIYRVLRVGGQANIKIDRDLSKGRLLRKDPTHIYRYGKREIEVMLKGFREKNIRSRLYLFNLMLKNKLFAELVK